MSQLVMVFIKLISITELGQVNSKTVSINRQSKLSSRDAQIHHPKIADFFDPTFFLSK